MVAVPQTERLGTGLKTTARWSLAEKGGNRMQTKRIATMVTVVAVLTLVLAAPILLLNTLGNYPAAYQLDLFHSSAPLAAYVTFASINGLARLIRFVQPKRETPQLPTPNRLQCRRC